jgi:hypothetical protein
MVKVKLCVDRPLGLRMLRLPEFVDSGT